MTYNYMHLRPHDTHFRMVSSYGNFYDPRSESKANCHGVTVCYTLSPTHISYALACTSEPKRNNPPIQFNKKIGRDISTKLFKANKIETITLNDIREIVKEIAYNLSYSQIIRQSIHDFGEFGGMFYQVSGVKRLDKAFYVAYLMDHTDIKGYLKNIFNATSILEIPIEFVNACVCRLASIKAMETFKIFKKYTIRPPTLKLYHKFTKQFSYHKFNYDSDKWWAFNCRISDHINQTHCAQCYKGELTIDKIYLEFNKEKL